MIEELRRRIEGEEFDYQILLDTIQGYAQPRDKITSLSGRMHRPRQEGYLYIEGRVRRRPFSRELLANVISGRPSSPSIMPCTTMV